MNTAIEVMQLGWLTKWLAMIVLSFAKTTYENQAHGVAALQCPVCDRPYGRLPSYPVLMKRFALVRCPCGKCHVGYKPFNGYT